MNISLTPELARWVEAMVRSGRYPSANEVVRVALCLLAERDRQQERKLDELRKFVAVGIEQSDQRELIEGPAAFGQVRERISNKAVQDA